MDLYVYNIKFCNFVFIEVIYDFFFYNGWHIRVQAHQLLEQDKLF